jgi:hypothetical protein
MTKPGRRTYTAQERTEIAAGYRAAPDKKAYLKATGVSQATAWRFMAASKPAKRPPAPPTRALVDPTVARAYRELHAELAIVDALAQLTPEKRTRVLRAAAILVGLEDPGERPARPVPTSASMHRPHRGGNT